MSNKDKTIEDHFNDLLSELEQATEAEDWERVDELCDEFNFYIVDNKPQFLRYFLRLTRVKYERIITILMALDPYEWHDFLIEQLRKYLDEARDLKKVDPILKEILETLVGYSDTVEEEIDISRDVQKELCKHLEDENATFRSLCFSLLAKASSHKSDIALNRLERLKSHADWKIRLSAYRTKNAIMHWKKNMHIPFMLRLRSLFFSDIKEV